MNIQRVWAMPSADTFDIAPIGELIRRYLRSSKVSIDPFARNKRWAIYTNDLNPDTSAEYHLEALEFLEMLKRRRVVADLVIFDPPYSLHQLKTTYEEAGGRMSGNDTGKINRWTEERTIIHELLSVEGVVISFGWSSNGMGRERGYILEEFLVVCHGAGHNDTLVIVERKQTYQANLFEALARERADRTQRALPGA